MPRCRLTRKCDRQLLAPARGSREISPGELAICWSVEPTPARSSYERVGAIARPDPGIEAAEASVHLPFGVAQPLAKCFHGLAGRQRPEPLQVCPFDFSRFGGEYRIERLPITTTDAFARRTVKRLIRFKD